MSGPKSSAPLRRAIGSLLSVKALENVSCTFDQLIVPLNILGGGAGNDDFADVNHDLINGAFSGKGSNLSSDKEFVVPYCDLGIGGDGEVEDGGVHYLFGRIGKEVGGTKYHELCCLTKRAGGPDIVLGGEMIPTEGQHANMGEHPLNQHSFKKKIAGMVPQDVKDELGEFLKKTKKKQLENERTNKRKAAREAEKAAKEERKRLDKAEKRAKEKAAKKAAEEVAAGGGSGEPRPNSANSGKSSSGKSPKTKRQRKGSSGRVTPVPPRAQQQQPQPQQSSQPSIEEELAALKEKEAEILSQCFKAKKEYLVFEKQLDEMKMKRNAMLNQQSSAVDSNAGKVKWISPGDEVMFIVKGRIGKVKATSFNLDELEDGLMPPPKGRADAKSDGVRTKRNYYAASVGASSAFIPADCALVPKNQLTTLRKKARVHKKLTDLFSGERCCFSQHAQTIMAIYDQHGYGASDEAIEMCKAGLLHALFHDIGFECSAENLAKGCQSQRSIARSELALAADCVVYVQWEMKQDGATVYCMMTDHGHRAGQEHFVILFCWAGRDENGNMTYKFFCPSVDSAGHSAELASEAAKKVIERFFPDQEVELVCLMGDAGGGASALNMFPKLKELGVMDELSKMSTCSMHGFQKALEVASIQTMGDQGNGVRSAFQMIFVFALIMDWIRLQGGSGFQNDLWAIVNDAIICNPDYGDQGTQRFKQAYYMFLDKVESFDIDIEVAKEEFNKFVNEAPSDIPKPIWSRWQTVIKVAKIFLENYATIYFLAVGLKTKSDSESYPWKLSCSLISLMNERAEPKLTETTDTTEDFVDTFNENNEQEMEADSDDCLKVLRKELKPGDSPTFYTQLLFHRAFCEYVFNDTYAFLMRNDPYFGTFGQSARLMPERTHVIHKRLCELKDRGWEGKTEFAQFEHALKGVPEESEHLADRAYFYKLAEDFINIFEQTAHKHVLDRWRTNEMISYAAVGGGDPEITREFAKMLFVHDCADGSGLVEEDAEAGVLLEEPKYNVESRNVTLGEHHQMCDDKPVVIDMKECMEFLTSLEDEVDATTGEIKRKGFSLKEIRKDKLINKHWKLIEKLAVLDDTVRLFDKDENGAVDKSTWAGVDFTPLLDDIWKKVGIHSHHQQRCENYVQLAALISKTMVGEARRTWRAIALSTTIRRFNLQTLNAKREKEKDPEKRKKIRRARGTERITLLHMFVEEFMAIVKRAKEQLPEGKFETIYNNIATTANKASAAEKQAFIDDFQESVNEAYEDYTTYKKEAVKGFTPTAIMGGKVLLKILTKKNDMESVIDCEIRARKIDKEEDFISKHGAEADFETISITEKKAMLKLHEARQTMKKNEQLNEEEAKKKTNAIIPHSDELKEVLTRQMAILNKD